MVLMVVVHAASVQEQDGAKRVLQRVQGRHPRLRLIWADAGYQVQWLIDWVAATCQWVLEIVKRPEGSKGFVLLPETLGRRTDFWLAESLSPVEQRLRSLAA